MAVTEYWIVWDDQRGTVLDVATSEAEADNYRREGWWVEGPMVDAATHRGAVKTLAKIAELSEPRHGRTEDERVQALADIHFLARGQS